jgi:hypothetical protein
MALPLQYRGSGVQADQEDGIAEINIKPPTFVGFFVCIDDDG